MSEVFPDQSVSKLKETQKSVRTWTERRGLGTEGMDDMECVDGPQHADGMEPPLFLAVSK